jgi:hypothetical protein
MPASTLSAPSCRSVFIPFLTARALMVEASAFFMMSWRISSSISSNS